MEKTLSILRQLTSRLGVLGNIPPPIAVSLMGFGLVVGIMIVFKSARLDPGERLFLIIAIVLLGVITGGYYLWKWWSDKKQNKQFGSEIAQHSTATPRPISDPGHRARLDDLRKKFQTGVEAYRSRGKDMYKLPWYVMVGEPGSGKTEAIRHSNVGFPPGMQDEFQGVGGTINMNWWFTNHAVILDTAGRLIFEDVKPGETSEWKEFLTLLKKNRPNCPINGLFLVIPSESLIKDSTEEIQKKAGKIAQQLGLIQRVLDIRFPVLLLITKCDKINGFREFFDGVTDPELQHQMLGWANRESLDEPYKPETVIKHLEQVAVRLRRRRMGLLRDPVPENIDSRRADEVDSLFAFPQSLEQLNPRLRQYLEAIFAPGEWSPKPLFLRGIFFSSSMREGAALDADLAQAIGVKVEELPEGKVWERERAFFLRDLFLEKVFRERGLVTRATNTKAMLRTQQLVLLGSSFVFLAAFLAIAWKAKTKLKAGTEQAIFWQVVQANGWTNKTWRGGLVPVTPNGTLASSPRTNAVEVSDLGTNYAFGEFQLRMREQTEKPLAAKSIFFPGLPKSYEQNRRKAQRIFFDDSVVYPLLQAARKKLEILNIDSASAQFAPEALAALIQLESDILMRKAGTASAGNPQEKSKRFLEPLLDYVAGYEVPLDPNLVTTMAWTYWTNNTPKDYWPPPWCSGVLEGTNDLRNNFPIAAGIAQLTNSAINDLKSHLTQGQQISSLLEAARRFYQSESALFNNAGADVDRGRFIAVHKEVLLAAADLKDKGTALESLSGSMSLSNAYKQFESTVISNTVKTVERVEPANNQAKLDNKNQPLFIEIETRLKVAKSNLTNEVQRLLRATNATDLDKLEEHFDTNAFQKRVIAYALANKQFANETSFAKEGLVGFKGAALETFINNLNSTGYTGRLANAFSRVLRDYQKRATRDYFSAYMNEASKVLSGYDGFPLVVDTNRMLGVEECKAAAKQLNLMYEDLGSAAFRNASFEINSESWKTLGINITNRQKVAKVLVNGNGDLNSCFICVEAGGYGNDGWRNSWRDIKLSSGRESWTLRTGSNKETEQKVPLQQSLDLFLINNAHESRNQIVIPIKLEEWGPIRLLLQYRSTRLPNNTWRVNVEFTESKGRPPIIVPLKLRFEGELPSPDQWPRR